MTTTITTYSMSQDTARLGFAIRDERRVTRTGNPHRHEFFQMRFEVEGEAYHHIGRRRQRLAPGSMSFVLPYRIHRGGRGADSRFYVINFDHRFLRPGLDIDPLCLEAVALENAPELAPFAYQEFIDFRLEGRDFELAREACSRMIEQSARPRFCSTDLIRANLLLVLGTVCQRYEAAFSRFAQFAPPRNPREPLVRVARYIREHLAEPISLTDVANAAGVSANYVTSLLKRETGKTFMQLLTDCRLQKAQELLASTSMRIGDVADAAGFEDNAYFARRFKQFFRVSPRQWRDVAARR